MIFKNNTSPYLAVALTLLVSSKALAEAAPAALSLATSYTGEVWRGARGDVAGNRYLDNLDITLDVHGEQAFENGAWRMFGYALYNNGRAFNDELIGTVQGISNIEASRALRLYELWADWQSPTMPLSLRFGLYDLNSEFDAIEAAGLFISPSHGIGADFSQSGENGPSIFPVTSLALRARVDIGSWNAQLVALDGVPGDPDHPKRTTIHLSSDEGALLVGEVNYTAANGARVGFGHWRYTAEFDDLTAVDANGDARRRSDNAGTYLLVQSPSLFADRIAQGLDLFARIGIANQAINAIRRYVGAGVVVNLSDDSHIGVAAAIATLGGPARELRAANGELVTSAETNIELTYRRALTDWLTVQADVQYVQHPNMAAAPNDAWIFGVRFEVGREWRW